MKLRTSELTGAALDWAVSKCEYPEVVSDDRFMVIFKHQQATGTGYCFSRDWAQGGPIIEREGITLYLYGDSEWNAHVGGRESVGPTPLVAAMRCYVASKLGAEVDLPEVLEKLEIPEAA